MFVENKPNVCEKPIFLKINSSVISENHNENIFVVSNNNENLKVNAALFNVLNVWDRIAHDSGCCFYYDVRFQNSV